MSKLKAVGSCAGTFLLGSLVIGGIGAIILAIFPKSTSVVSSVLGFILLILLWNAVDTLLKSLKKKEEVPAPAEAKPAEPGTQA